MFFSILFAVLMSSIIAFGTKESPPVKTQTPTTVLEVKDTSIAMKKTQLVGEEFKYSQLIKKG